jgi:hypothetical protein
MTRARRLWWQIVDWWSGCRLDHAITKIEQGHGRLYVRCQICGLRTDGFEVTAPPRYIAPARRQDRGTGTVAQFAPRERRRA